MIIIIIIIIIDSTPLKVQIYSACLSARAPMRARWVYPVACCACAHLMEYNMSQTRPSYFHNGKLTRIKEVNRVLACQISCIDKDEERGEANLPWHIPYTLTGVWAEIHICNLPEGQGNIHKSWRIPTYSQRLPAGGGWGNTLIGALHFNNFYQTHALNIAGVVNESYRVFSMYAFKSPLWSTVRPPIKHAHATPLTDPIRHTPSPLGLGGK